MPRNVARVVPWQADNCNKWNHRFPYLLSNEDYVKWIITNILFNNPYKLKTLKFNNPWKTWNILSSVTCPNQYCTYISFRFVSGLCLLTLPLPRRSLSPTTNMKAAVVVAGSPTGAGRQPGNYVIPPQQHFLKVAQALRECRPSISRHFRNSLRGATGRLAAPQEVKVRR